MVYKRVIINGEVYPGESIKGVIYPTPTAPYWTIIYKDGTRAYTTGPITVEEKK